MSTSKREAKLLVFIPKRRDITVAQFHEHWRTTHAQLALKIQSLDRYVQNHRLRRMPAAFPSPPFAIAPYLGVAEGWLADVEAADAMGADPEYVEGARVDEPNFMDVESKCNLICRELCVVEAQTARGRAAKVFLMLQRHPKVCARHFEAAWSDSDRWRHVRDVTPLEGVTINYPLPATYVNRRPAPFDFVIELWWPPESQWDTALNDAISLFVNPDQPSLGDGSMAMAVEEVRFL